MLVVGSDKNQLQLVTKDLLLNYRENIVKVTLKLSYSNLYQLGLNKIQGQEVQNFILRAKKNLLKIIYIYIYNYGQVRGFI